MWMLRFVVVAVLSVGFVHAINCHGNQCIPREKACLTFATSFAERNTRCARDCGPSWLEDLERQIEIDTLGSTQLLKAQCCEADRCEAAEPYQCYVNGTSETVKCPLESPGCVGYRTVHGQWVSNGCAKARNCDEERNITINYYQKNFTCCEADLCNGPNGPPTSTTKASNESSRASTITLGPNTSENTTNDLSTTTKKLSSRRPEETTTPTVPPPTLPERSRRPFIPDGVDTTASVAVWSTFAVVVLRLPLL